MKTTPTETDREAGRAFVPWPAMRVMWTATSRRWERIADGTAHTGHPFAIDTDDPATVGCMVAQVEAAAGAPVDVWAYSRHTGIEHEVDSYDGTTLGCGPSRGAALVAAKRALAEAAKKRTEGATRMVMEQRASAEARKNRQTADINKRNAQRTEVRRACLLFASGEVDAVGTLRAINSIMELNIAELDEPKA